MAKADNMLAILMLLRARNKMTASQLAEELEIHIRTVYRCIDALCASGVPIVSETGRNGGYFIRENVKLDPLFFDAEEHKALLHAAQFVRESGYPQMEALNRAINMRGEIRSFRVDRIGRIRRTDIPFQRPAHFSAREFLLGNLLPESPAEADDQQVLVHISGSPQALDDLCAHWLFGHALVERTPSRAVFQLDERFLFAQAPHYLLSYGSKIQILQPPELKTCLAELAESLLHHYRM